MITDILELGGEIINKIIPDPEARAKARLELVRLQAEGQTRDIEARMSAIVMEAKSSDPWTSRARPSFMYVFYLILIVNAVIVPTAGVFAPEAVTAYQSGLAAAFAAIPAELWTTFTVGYLGYAGARTYEKRGLMKDLPWKKG